MAPIPLSSLATQVVHLQAEISRLLVLGDPHGALHTVEGAFTRERDGRTMAVCVGDVVGYADGPSSSALAEFLMNEAVPTVEGNHEDWVREDGTLSIVQERDAVRLLSSETIEWMKTLPAQIEFRREGDSACLALMIHSIRRPNWDWIAALNAPFLLKQLNRPRLVLSGHSHRPKFIAVSAEMKVSVSPFDFENDDEVSIDLPEAGSLIVDAGSLGRAELEPGLKPHGAPRGSSQFGTYAVIDFELRRAFLRRIPKGDDH